MPFDLHRHDEYSSFDGFGKASELAALAKEYGYKSLCSTNHGNTNGLIQTYVTSKEAGIKPILGVEGYFLPVYKPQTKGFHLVVIAKNLKGYGNMNRLQYEGEKQKYYNPIWTFELLEKYHEGLICSTACVGGYLGQCIKRGELAKARAFLKKLKSIFGKDLYVEVQPYKVTEEGLQEKVNVESIKLAKELGIKLILTSDSHYGSPDDFDTYIKMHEIAGHNIEDIKATYKERYMPKPDELKKRFYKMHKADFGEAETKQLALEMYANLDAIEEECELNYLDALPLQLPKLHDGDSSYKALLMKVKEGLKARGKTTKEYVDRCKQELEVIKFHGFEDYFLMVADYVNWAKDNGIAVGPGRGSVCNSLVAYALKITEVDCLKFGLDFRRFLRKDKTSFPDIDIDFETSRRHEVIEYLCKKYEGHSARICSYGLYKVDNLLNDLAKVCGLMSVDEAGKQVIDKGALGQIKSFVNGYINEGILDKDGLISSAEYEHFNKEYDDIAKHFVKLFKKVRFIGTHAAGVAITGGQLLDYTAIRIDSKSGDLYTNYDLADIDVIHVIKFDILGLKTMESIGDLRRETGVQVDYDEVVDDKEVLNNFNIANTDGVFQFETGTPRGILTNIQADCFNDVCAASAMNRPGPLSLKQPDLYAANKFDQTAARSSAYWEYTEDSYGTIIYQEQVQRISVYIGKMPWETADKVMKMMKSTTGATERAVLLYEQKKDALLKEFVAGATQSGMDADDAANLFENMICYTFNKGHAVGYTLITFEEMFYKTHYPNEFWFAKLKYAKDEAERDKFSAKAVLDGSVLFLPHVNYSGVKSRLRKVDGANAIQQGLAEIKNVGEKAAQFIAEERKANGIFTSYDDFYDRCKSRVVTSRVIDALSEQGALEFNKKRYLSRVTKYNSALYARSLK